MNKSIKFHAENCGAVFNVAGLGKADSVMMSEEQLQIFAKLIVNDCLDMITHQMLMDEISGVETGIRQVRFEYEVE